MHFLNNILNTVIGIVAFSTLASATLDPAISHSTGQYFLHPGCKPATITKGIQAAECGYNTRTHDKQTFAMFTIDHQWDNNHGAPYGTCRAYTCSVPVLSELIPDPDRTMFFWDDEVKATEGVGTDCIKDPHDGSCGCERSSDGKFFDLKNNCV
uniref:Small secreted protein 1 n=1 Tax=Ciboria carunculoides TaxID=984308 RepID=A0A895GBY4_9HELO|nr:small secreted protein 1 [Ciboria carunculoides]